jgi:RNA polymerase sigma-70 factor (ECF subfamily)
MWSQKEQISTVKNVKAFLAVSAHNASIDYLRKQKNGYQFFQTYAKAHRCYFDPNEYFDQKETVRCLRLAIESLSPQRKIVFILGWVEGSTREQIAKRLGISPNTVKNLMQHARRDIQIFFKQHTGMKRLNALKIMKFVWQRQKVSKVA